MLEELRDLSVVVQGPVMGGRRDAEDQQLTRRCLASVRNHLPEAQIVLSTWRGSDLANLSFDVLIENDDPGPVYYTDLPGKSNNVNRQITTTRNGLLAADRRYSLKLRSDMIVEGTGFADYFNRFPVRCDWSFLKSKVVSSTMYARIPGHIFQWPFHPGDWFFFGETQDVRDIWDIPLSPEPDFTNWFVGRPRPLNDQWPTHMSRYMPEQYIWLSFLRKHREVHCDYQWDLSAETILNTEKSFAGNLILISPRQAQLSFAKYVTHTGWTGQVFGPSSCYNHALWRHLYAKHCLEKPRSVFALATVGSYVTKRAAAPALIAAARTKSRLARMKRRLLHSA
jgi:hypothetical protein